MATLINERYRLSKEVQKLTIAIKQAKQGLNEYKDALSKRKPFADGAIPLTLPTKKTKKNTKKNHKEKITSTAKRSSPRRGPKMDVAQTETGAGVATKKDVSNVDDACGGDVGKVDATNVDQPATPAGGDASNDMANVDAKAKSARKKRKKVVMTNVGQNVDQSMTPAGGDDTTNVGVPPDAKKRKRNDNKSAEEQSKEKKAGPPNKRLPLRGNLTASDPPVLGSTQFPGHAHRLFQVARIEDISSKFANQWIKGWPFKCPSMFVAWSNIIPFPSINAVINYLQNEMYQSGKLSGTTTAELFSMIHRFIIEGEVDSFKAILPQPSRKHLIAPFTLQRFKEGMDNIVGIVKASQGADPTSVCFLKRRILYYQFVAQYCLAQIGMINTYHDVDCFSNDFHDPKTFKDGNNLHQFIIRQQYNDLLKVFNSPSLIREMKSMTVIKQKMKTKDLPDVLNLAYLKQMCAKQLNYIMPLCSDSVLVPLDPLPANQHSPDKNASSSLPETPTNVAEVSSTLLSAPFPTAPADDDAQGQSPAPTHTANEAPVQAAGLVSADVFNINHFLNGFSSSDNINGRMSEVMNKIAYNKMLKMGVTFVNQARGRAELVLNKNRHTDCKSLPYLSSVGIVSRKAMPKKARGKKLAGPKNDVDHDEQGGDGDDGTKKKGNEVFEQPNRTGRSGQDVKELLEFKGKDGHGIYANVVTSLLECHETASFIHDPMLYLSEVKLTTKFYICFTNMPYKKSMRCDKHPYGCGLSLKVGDVVRVYAVEKCRFIKGVAWYIPVHLIQPSGNIGCCVGIAKTFPTQAHILANRTAIVSELVGMTDTSGGDVKETQAIGLLCSHAIATFIDVTVPRNVSKQIESAAAAI